MTWRTVIPTRDGEPTVTIVNSTISGRPNLVLHSRGFEACLSMDIETMRGLRDALDKHIALATPTEVA